MLCSTPAVKSTLVFTGWRCKTKERAKQAQLLPGTYIHQIRSCIHWVEERFGLILHMYHYAAAPPPPLLWVAGDLHVCLLLLYGSTTIGCGLQNAQVHSVQKALLGAKTQLWMFATCLPFLKPAHTQQPPGIFGE